MQILSLQVKSISGLSIAPIIFQNPTLLVGLSGSGKSQILSITHDLIRLLLGDVSPVLDDGDYQLEFLVADYQYRYRVQIEAQKIKETHLWRDGVTHVPLSDEFNAKIDVNMVKSVDFIRGSDDLLKRLSQATFDEQEEVKSLYQFIFPNMEAIEIPCCSHAWELRFKEKNLDWISYRQLSDGMLKTFLYVCELVLNKPGTVLLIDEFENGLGLNCMDVLLEEMIHREDVQFILTSHHPYIINNIPTLYWQIINRQKDMITARTPEEVGIGQTRYDAFFELMNRLYYEEEH